MIIGRSGDFFPGYCAIYVGVLGKDLGLDDQHGA